MGRFLSQNNMSKTIDTNRACPQKIMLAGSKLDNILLPSVSNCIQ